MEGAFKVMNDNVTFLRELIDSDWGNESEENAKVLHYFQRHYSDILDKNPSI